MKRMPAWILLGLGLLFAAGPGSPARADAARAGIPAEAEVGPDILPGGDPGSGEEQAAYGVREASSAGLEKFRGGYVSGPGVAILLLLAAAVTVGAVLVVGYLVYKGVEVVLPPDAVEPPAPEYE